MPDGFAGRRVLVTGGTGLVGRQVVKRLAGAGAIVRTASLDRLELVDQFGPAQSAGSGVTEHRYGDLTDPLFCRAIVRGVDAVCHLAGIKGSVDVTTKRPASFLVPLLQMNTNLLEAARQAGIRQLVYTSSIGAYPSREIFREEDAWDGPPMDVFPGWAKRMGELQIDAYRREHGLDWATVRLTNVYGPGDNFDPASAMVIPSLIARIAGGEDPLVVWGDGSAVRDFAYSGDVADGILLALARGTGGEVVNLGSGEPVSIRELVETLAKVIPFRSAFDATKPAGFPRRVMDIGRARERLGYAPKTSLLEGLKATWAWYLANRRAHEAKQDYFAPSEAESR